MQAGIKKKMKSDDVRTVTGGGKEDKAILVVGWVVFVCIYKSRSYIDICISEKGKKKMKETSLRNELHSSCAIFIFFSNFDHK